METKQLYYVDCHLSMFAAKVLQCTEVQKGFEVVLDQIHLGIADSTSFSDAFCDNDSLTYALQKLSAKERHIFLTHVLDEKSFVQIADEMGMKWKSVATVYYRTVTKLKELLKGDFE